MKKHRKKRRKPYKLVLIILLVPLASWYLWIAQKSTKTNIFVLDKTVPSIERNEHKGFFWILNHYNYLNEKEIHYSIEKDYFGFFPIDVANQKFDFKSIRLDEIQKISEEYDMLYYTDTYGVYSTSAYSERTGSQRLYGGLNNNDYLLLKEMKEKKKLILTEYNLFASPTSELVREKTEDLFNINWSGWTGKYYSSLDTTRNPELQWVVNTYEEQNNNSWQFRNPGIVFVNKSGKIVILEKGTHLDIDVPVIVTTEYGQQKYKLPQKIMYPYWFDIIYSGEKNTIVSEYQLSVNSKGDSILNSNLIPITFPAMIEHTDDYLFYYFSGDFADNEVSLTNSYFKGIRYIDFLFYSNYRKNRNQFFWKYYLPLISSILEEEYTDDD